METFHTAAQYLLIRKSLDPVYTYCVLSAVELSLLATKNVRLNFSFVFGDVVCCSFSLTAPRTLLSSRVGSDIDFPPPPYLALCSSSTQFARIQFQDGHERL